MTYRSENTYTLNLPKSKADYEAARPYNPKKGALNMAKARRLKKEEVKPGVMCIVNPNLDEPTLYRVKEVDGWNVKLEYEARPGHFVGGGDVDAGMLYRPK